MSVRRALCALAAALALCALAGGAAADMILPAGLKEIAAEAFRGSGAISAITVPEGVQAIRAWAFADSGLTEITLPASLTFIDDSAFSGCGEITVHAQEGTYAYTWAASQGMIREAGEPTPATDFTYQLNKAAGTATITRYTGAGGEVNVPSAIEGCAVTAIGWGAFQNSRVTRVTLPESVDVIDTYAFAGCMQLKEITLPTRVSAMGSWVFDSCQSLTSVRIPQGAETVGMATFSGCTSLRRVTLPDSVTAIEDFAFFNCPALERVGMSSALQRIGTYAFLGCASLKGIALPDSVTSIGSDAFNSCLSLTELAIPAGMTTIPSGLCNYCVGLKSVTVRGSVTSVEDWAFFGCSALETCDLPAGVTSVGSYAFTGCEKLRAVRLTDSLVRVGDNAFNGCSALEELYLSAGVTVIPDGLCHSCSGLKKLTLKGKVTSIGSMAFYGCRSLEALALPASVSSVGSYAFYGCAKVPQLRLTDSLTRLGEEAFNGCAALEELYLSSRITTIPARLCNGCESLRRVTCSGTVTEVKDWAFNGCAALEEISLNPGLTRLGAHAFSDCRALRSLTLGKGLKEVGAYAFSGCTALAGIHLPAGVTSVGRFAFSGCTDLAEVTLPDSVADLGVYAFQNCASLTAITLPASLREIADGVLDGCSALRTARVNSTAITSVGASAFRGCIRLETVNLPATVTRLGDYAFAWCGRLTDAGSLTAISSLGSRALEGCTGLTRLGFSQSLTSLGSQSLHGFSGYLTFAGNAPAIAADAFSQDSNVIAIYPHDRSGWAGMSGKTYGAGWMLWRADNADPAAYADQEKAHSEALSGTITDNEGKNEYEYVWVYGTITSSLTREADGTYTRVEYTDDGVVVEQYSAALRLIWKKTIQPELPVWGGFYAGEDYNFLVFGQENPYAWDHVEIMRVVRYTKNWNRVDAAPVYGGFTKYPFDFGTLRMTQAGDFLYIHTCHGMYVDHQASMTYTIYIPDMVYVHENNRIGGFAAYTSHSFNQFILYDGADIVRLDHGDAYPRGLKLTVNANAAGTPGEGAGIELMLMRFGGSATDERYQITGATVGGLEASASHYIVAGKSIDQTRFGATQRQNIYVAAADKGNLTESGVTLRWITAYPDSDPHYVSTPQLVKVSGSQFLLMWTESESENADFRILSYVFLDGQGAPTSGIYSAPGLLSDCQPIVSRGKVIWYVADGSSVRFYTLDPANPATVTER